MAKKLLQVTVHSVGPAAGGIQPAAPEKSEEDMERDGKWDHDTLMRAEEIKGDQTRMKYAMKHAEKHAQAVKSIQDLKDIYDAKYGEGQVKKKPAPHVGSKAAANPGGKVGPKAAASPGGQVAPQTDADGDED